MASRVRISTGVSNLNKLIEGGFIPGSCILVTGETGTGKTIFGCQFLNAGLENSETVLFITMEETPDEIMDDVARFGWDFSNNLMCIFEYIDPSQVDDIEEIIRQKVVENKAKRVVIDSLTLIGSYLESISDIRKKFYNIKRTLKDLGVTSVLISEIPKGSGSLSRFGVEEFLVDGVVELNVGVEVIGGKPRSLIIRKMRRTKHDVDVHPIEIGSNGIALAG